MDAVTLLLWDVASTRLSSAGLCCLDFPSSSRIKLKAEYQLPSSTTISRQTHLFSDSYQEVTLLSVPMCVCI